MSSSSESLAVAAAAKAIKALDGASFARKGRRDLGLIDAARRALMMVVVGNGQELSPSGRLVKASPTPSKSEGADSLLRHPNLTPSLAIPDECWETFSPERGESALRASVILCGASFVVYATEVRQAAESSGDSRTLRAVSPLDEITVDSMVLAAHHEAMPNCVEIRGRTYLLHTKPLRDGTGATPRQG